MNTALPKLTLDDYQDGVDLTGQLVILDPPCSGGTVIPWKPGDPGKPFGEVKEVLGNVARIERIDYWP